MTEYACKYSSFPVGLDTCSILTPDGKDAHDSQV
jgi:hypothetical protein